VVLYELALLGAPTTAQVGEISAELSRLLAPFSLRLEHEVAFSVAPQVFRPSQHHSAAAAFMGAAGVSDAGLSVLLDRGIPIIPVTSSLLEIAHELPAALRTLNAVSYRDAGAVRVATAVLECAGLLPRQRRVFVSYRRQGSREAALQLFDAFSARLFDVFLDTHGVPPADDFQAVLWHRLCDSDVLVMIDTAGYFESRWTQAEFGRALAKNISVLRIGWPGCVRSPRAATAAEIALDLEDVDPAGRLSDGAIERIVHQLEAQRSESIAVRHLNLVGSLQQGLQRIGGQVNGVGPHKGIHMTLPDGRNVVAYTSVTSPTSLLLHEVAEHMTDFIPALIYDHIGLQSDYLTHLDWLSEHIPDVRLVKACEAAWRFADWEH